MLAGDSWSERASERLQRGLKAKEAVWLCAGCCRPVLLQWAESLAPLWAAAAGR